MGQYYIIANLTLKRQMPCNGIKLLEHAYLNNSSTRYLLVLLGTDWFGDVVIEIGDYAEPVPIPGGGEGETATYKDVDEWAPTPTPGALFFNILNRDVEPKPPHTTVDAIQVTIDALLRCIPQENIDKLGEEVGKLKATAWKDVKRYFLNLDKKFFVDLKTYNREVSPTILLACGNGGGGGDYFGEDKELVGSWAGDHVGVADKVPEDGDWTEIKPCFGGVCAPTPDGLSGTPLDDMMELEFLRGKMLSKMQKPTPPSAGGGGKRGEAGKSK